MTLENYIFWKSRNFFQHVVKYKFHCIFKVSDAKNVAARRQNSLRVNLLMLLQIPDSCWHYYCKFYTIELISMLRSVIQIFLVFLRLQLPQEGQARTEGIFNKSCCSDKLESCIKYRYNKLVLQNSTRFLFLAEGQ